jgi:hypothetical protein
MRPLIELDQIREVFALPLAVDSERVRSRN